MENDQIASFVREKYFCTSCSKQYDHERSLIRHMQIHTGQFNFHCGQCKRDWNDSRDYKIHMDKHVSNARAITAGKCLLWLEPEIITCLYTLGSGAFHVVNATKGSTKEQSMINTVKHICERITDGIITFFSLYQQCQVSLVSRGRSSDLIWLKKTFISLRQLLFPEVTFISWKF